MVKGGSLKAALVAQQAKAARKAAQVKVQEALERKEKSMSGGNKQKNRRDKQQEKNLSKMQAAIEAADTTEGGKEKQPYRPRTLTYPFDATDTILLIGEGDFSYTLSILSPPHNHPPQRVLATAYDSEKECYGKYPAAEETVSKIRALGARVEFGLDAGAIEKCKAVGKARTWSRIVFNFPHAGESVTPNLFHMAYVAELPLDVIRCRYQGPRSKHPHQPASPSHLLPIRRTFPYRGTVPFRH
jgi:25S rRNA (uracil2634-N3)-methyltransferase